MDQLTQNQYAYRGWLASQITGIWLPYAIAATVLLSPSLSWQNWKVVRLIWASSSLASLAVGVVNSKLLEADQQLWEIHHQAQIEESKTLAAESLARVQWESSLRLESQMMPTPSIALPEAHTAKETETPDGFYCWEEARDSATGFLVSGRPGSGKSSMACFLAGLLTQDAPAQVLALDPHWNGVWALSGIRVEGEVESIDFVLDWIVEEIDRRYQIQKANVQQGSNTPMGDPIIIILDEVGELLIKLDPKVLKEQIQVIATAGRKVGISLIVLNQSANAGDIGLSAKYLDCFFQVGLCSMARELAINFFGKDSPEYTYCLQTAYPALVCRSVDPQLALHGTHWQYDHFKKVGNPPLGLKHINQLPLTIPLVSGGELPLVGHPPPLQSYAPPTPPPPLVDLIQPENIPNISITTSEIQRARMMANEGHSLNQISSSLGISKNSKKYHDLKIITGL